MGCFSELDRVVVESLSDDRNPGLVSLFTLITHLGEGWVVGLLAVVVLVFLVRKKLFDHAVALADTLFTTGVLTVILKYLVGRERQPEAYVAFSYLGPSFPSAHTALSVAFFGYLLYLMFVRKYHIFYHLENRFSNMATSWAVYACSLALLVSIPLLVGLSRIYLLLHYPTDVIAGFVLGITVLLCSIWGLERGVYARLISWHEGRHDR